jgi:hypothetical protein
VQLSLFLIQLHGELFDQKLENSWHKTESYHRLFFTCSITDIRHLQHRRERREKKNKQLSLARSFKTFVKSNELIFCCNRKLVCEGGVRVRVMVGKRVEQKETGGI